MSKITNIHTITCNQCFKEMGEWEYEHEPEAADPHGFPICFNEKCPNFALFQVPVERLPKATFK